MTEPRDSHEPTQKYFDSSIPTGSVSDIMIYDRAMHIYWCCRQRRTRDASNETKLLKLKLFKFE